MAKSIKDFLGYAVGDVVTLSDIQTQETFNSPTVDYAIKEIREYVEPNGVFKYTCYLIENSDSDGLMLLVREVGDDFDMLICYKVGEFVIDEMIAKTFLNPEKEDFADTFIGSIQTEEGEDTDVLWVKKDSGTTFGVTYNSTGGPGKAPHHICEYQNDTWSDNPHAFMDWIDNPDGDGYLEVFYGSEIKTHEVEIMKAGEE